MERTCENCLHRNHNTGKSCRDLFCLGHGYHDFVADTKKIEDRIEELQAKLDSEIQAFGRLYAEACFLMDDGQDIRDISMPELRERCVKSLGKI